MNLSLNLLLMEGGSVELYTRDENTEFWKIIRSIQRFSTELNPWKFKMPLIPTDRVEAY